MYLPKQPANKQWLCVAQNVKKRTASMKRRQKKKKKLKLVASDTLYCCCCCYFISNGCGCFLGSVGEDMVGTWSTKGKFKNYFLLPLLFFDISHSGM